MTQPVQEPTQGRVDSAQEFRTRQLFRRPAIVNPGGSGGGYLQARGALWGGAQFQRLTSLNNYLGGNDSDPVGGTWQWVDDPTSPFNQMALETTVDQDWFPFCVGNLGPQYTGYAVAVWYYGDTDAPDIQIEWATTSVDEAANTSGPVGSSTSIVGPNDMAYWSAPAFDWYNTNNLGDFANAYRWDAYTTSPGWGVVIERSPFFLAGVDGTPLTANASGYGDFESCKAFNGGGGPDLAWWVRLFVNGKNGSSSGYHAKIGQVEVYRFNGVNNDVS